MDKDKRAATIGQVGAEGYAVDIAGIYTLLRKVEDKLFRNRRKATWWAYVLIEKIVYARNISRALGGD